LSIDRINIFLAHFLIKLTIPSGRILHNQQKMTNNQYFCCLSDKNLLNLGLVAGMVDDQTVPKYIQLK
jgi:hypothetical protein